MIIYGTGTKELGTKKLPGAKCSNCESNDLHLHVGARYFSVFWIPVFPFSKKMSVFCDHCQKVYQKKELDPQLKEKLKFEKKNFKTPVTLFAGVIIIAALVLYFIYDAAQSKVELTNNIKALEKEDVIVFDEKSKTYSFAKVTDVSSDTIYVQFSNYVYEGGVPSQSTYNKEKSGVNDFYRSEVRYYLQSDLDSLFNNGTVQNVFKSTLK